MDQWDEPEGQTVSWSAHSGISVASPFNSARVISKKDLEDQVAALEKRILVLESKMFFYLQK